MRGGVSLALLYVASALLYAAHRGRPARVHNALGQAKARRRAQVARWLSGMAVAVAFWLWRTVESGPAPFFVTLVGLMCMGTFVTLLGPLRPRWVWALAVLCALSVVPALLFGEAP